MWGYQYRWERRWEKKRGRCEAQTPSHLVKNYKQTWRWAPSDVGSRTVWNFSSVYWPAPPHGHRPRWSSAWLFKVSKGECWLSAGVRVWTHLKDVSKNSFKQRHNLPNIFISPFIFKISTLLRPPKLLMKLWKQSMELQVGYHRDITEIEEYHISSQWADNKDLYHSDELLFFVHCMDLDRNIQMVPIQRGQFGILPPFKDMIES